MRPEPATMTHLVPGRPWSARLRHALARDPWTPIALLALTVAGFYLRFYHLHDRGAWWDEVATWHDALSGHRNAQEAPLNTWASYLVMAVMRRNDDFALHCAGALFGALTVPAGFFLGHAIAGRRCGLLVATLALVSPSLLYFAQEARPYALLVLVTTLQLAFAVRLLTRWTRLDLIGLLVFGAASTSAHLVALPFTLAVGGILVLHLVHQLVVDRAQRSVNRRRLLAFVTLGGLALGVGLSWTYFRPPFAPVMTGPYTLGLRIFVRFVITACGPRGAEANRPWDRLDLTLAAYVVLALAGLIALAARGRIRIGACVLLAPVATLVGLYLQLGDKSTWAWFKYGTPTLMPFLALVAAGLCARGWRWTVASLAAFLFVAHGDIRVGLRGWEAGTYGRKGGVFVDAARAIADDPRFVGTIFAPQKSVFGDESDRLMASYAMVRKDRLPAYFAPWHLPLTRVEWRRTVGRREVPVRTEEQVEHLPPGNYAVFLGWDSYRGCEFLTPELTNFVPPVQSGTFIPCRTVKPPEGATPRATRSEP